MKLWIKIINDGKIKKHVVYAPEHFNLGEILTYIEDACNSLDEPTPIILNKHLAHLNEFNSTAFKPVDFVEHVDFDKMVIEIFDENSHKEKEKK